MAHCYSWKPKDVGAQCVGAFLSVLSMWQMMLCTFIAMNRCVRRGGSCDFISSHAQRDGKKLKLNSLGHVVLSGHVMRSDGGAEDDPGAFPPASCSTLATHRHSDASGTLD